MPDDQDNLRNYVTDRSESAMRELVARHIDMVYGTAIRMLNGDADMAKDVVQLVFVHLARNAWRLPEDVVLAGWLYRHTCYTASGLARAEQRRRKREQIAMELNSLENPEPGWEAVGPHVDEALNELSRADREALVLRFLKQQGFREVGLALGISDDAAQKRVTRALERMRALLTRRGVGLSSASLACLLTANSVVAAPAALLTTVASAASAAGFQSGVISTLFKIMTVTKFKATVVMAAVGVGLVLPLTVHHHAQAMLRIGDEKLRDEDKKLAILKTENASLSAMVEQTKPSVAGESSRSVELARLRNEVGTLMREVRAKSGSNEPVTLEEKAEARKQHIAEQAIHLRGWFEAHPEAMIPEFKVIGEESWQFSASQNELQTEHDLRRAAANLRANAEHAAFLDPIAGALRRYLKENNDRFPAELSQLTPYLRSPIDDAILQRYEIVPTTTLVPSLRVVGDWAITERAPVDSSMDSRQVVGARLGTFADERVVDRWTFKP